MSYYRPDSNPNKVYETLDDLKQDFDCDWLESRVNPDTDREFHRVTTEPEGSCWYCADCESTDVDSFLLLCETCDEDWWDSDIDDIDFEPY